MSDYLERRLTALILGRTAPDAARAIVADLGLTVETRRDLMAIESEWRPCPCCAGGKAQKSRIVGNWESQCRRI